MPRTAQSPLFALIEQLGRQLGQQLAATVASSQGGAAASRSGTGGSRRPTAGAACAVDGCPRNAVAKGVCQNHYAKAKRLGFDLDALSAAQRSTLAEDGRATRFQRAKAATGGGRKGRGAKKK